jgi:hypothetical protein
MEMKHFAINAADKPVAILAAADLIMAQGFIEGQFDDGKLFIEQMLARGYSGVPVTLEMATLEQIEKFEEKLYDVERAGLVLPAGDEHCVIWLDATGVARLRNTGRTAA